jgi:hypothetical protein
MALGLFARFGHSESTTPIFPSSCVLIRRTCWEQDEGHRTRAPEPANRHDQKDKKYVEGIMPIFVSQQHLSGPVQNDLESVLRIADLVQNSPGPNSSYDVYLAHSYTQALDLAWETHSKSSYPVPEVWGHG